VPDWASAVTARVVRSPSVGAVEKPKDFVQSSTSAESLGRFFRLAYYINSLSLDVQSAFVVIITFRPRWLIHHVAESCPLYQPSFNCKSRILYLRGGRGVWGSKMTLSSTACGLKRSSRKKRNSRTRDFQERGTGCTGLQREAVVHVDELGHSTIRFV
jgi:hypothetical protein